MRYSDMAARTGGMGDEAWEIHRRAWEKEAAGEPVIVLSAGEERTATTHPIIVDAAKKALDAGRHHYAPLTGSLVLKQAVLDRHKALTGQEGIGTDSCCVLAGAQNALFTAMLCLAGAGDEVIVPEPYYATYPGVCRAGGATMVTVPCDPEAGFVVDPDRIAAAITPKSRVLLINSPNNPTGAIYPKPVMEAIAELCIKHDLWLISDEVYADFVYDAPTQAGDIISRMFPPRWSYMDRLWWSLWDTLNIATLGTLLGVIIAVPVAFLAARNTSPSPTFLRPLALFIIVGSRSINSLIWALLLVAIIGPGVMAGIIAIGLRSIGFIAKLLYEAIEEIDHNQVEAVAATGASRAQVMDYAIVPQILPAFAGITVFRWDINIRESAILGLVGAGGIGLQLQASLNVLAWPQVTLIFIVILATVAVSEWVSAKVRQAII